MKKIKNSFFLVIEGLDGSGKTSIARSLVKNLQTTCKDVKLTFEPHDPSCAGLFIRQILMKKISNVPPKTLALAFAANRADHCDREINPFLNSNGGHRIIVCDRYYLSSLVYQSVDNLSFEDVMMLNDNVTTPDLTIFLNVSNKTCYERMRIRNDDKELFENSLKKTRGKYQSGIEFLRKRGDNIVEIEAEGSLSDVLKNVIDVLSENSPSWINIQYPLLEPSQEIFKKTNVSIKNVSDRFSNLTKDIMIFEEDQLIEILENIKEQIKSNIKEMKFNDVGTLFLDMLVRSGYELHDRFPWTDLDAFELKFSLPLEMNQRGAALLLGEVQRPDEVITKLQRDPKITTLDTMSDFLYIFDSYQSYCVNGYYEREIINYRDSSSLSPTLKIFNRSDIAAHVFNQTLKSFFDEYHLTLNSIKKLKDVFLKYYNPPNKN